MICLNLLIHVRCTILGAINLINKFSERVTRLEEGVREIAVTARACNSTGCS